MTTGELAGALRRLVTGTGHWTPAAWSAPAAGTSLDITAVRGDAGAPVAVRAEVVHALVQQIADLAADAEALPHRPVPRLDNDLALPDQLRVVAADLMAADPSAPQLSAADHAVQAARHQLWP